jgi:uncharacterized protein
MSEASATAEVAPVKTADRILSLDVLRGFALLGILAVNAAYFSAPWQTGFDPTIPPLGVNDQTMWSWLVMHVFFELKCITLFSMLFGASIYMVGGERRDKSRGAVLRRRLMWLALFGLIHGLLIWYGDILFHYALVGFIALLMRSWKPRTLFIVGGILYILAFGMQTVSGPLLALVPPEQLEEILGPIEAAFAVPPAEFERMQAAFQGGVLSSVQENIAVWLVAAPNSILGFIPRTLGVMLIGMGLLKVGFLSGRAPAWLYALMTLIGAASLAVIAYQAQINWALRFDTIHMLGAGLAANVGLSIFVSIGYASALILLVKAGAKLLIAPLAAVGRMAFTNYIAQSLIMTTIFYGGRGFGLWGEVDRVTLWAIVLGVWAAQLIWSPIWLSRFSMGPLEWVWRRLSYGKQVSMAKEASADA